jgi:cardiolipin synthase
MGAEWHPMLPLRPLRGQWQRRDLRNHRKLVVVDGIVGHTGSQNLINDSYHKKVSARLGLHSKELMVRVEGPSVAELDAVFATDWYSETGEVLDIEGHPDAGANADSATAGIDEVAGVDIQVVPSGPSFENDNNLKLFALMLQNARRRISITSPYFVPEESTHGAAFEALQHRRRRRRDRHQQHGHPVFQPQHGGVAAGAQSTLRGSDAPGRRSLPRAQ